MKLNELKRLMNLNQDMINIFTDYAYGLDKYFSKEKNRLNHKVLYEEYQVLNQNLKALKGKYKL